MDTMAILCDLFGMVSSRDPKSMAGWQCDLQIGDKKYKKVTNWITMTCFVIMFGCRFAIKSSKIGDNLLIPHHLVII